MKSLEDRQRYMRFEELADALDEIAVHYRLQDRDHVAHQYTKASSSLRKAEFIPPDPSDLDNIGEAVRDDIAEWRAFGEISRLEEMREKRPYLNELTQVKSLGPKLAQRIYKDTGVETIDGLEELLDSGEIKNIEGIGEKTMTTFRRSVGQMNEKS